MSVRFNPGGLPFPRWVGPYVPARGKKAGFKVLQGRLGAWVEEGDASAFWTIRTSPGAAQLERLVCKHWRGGGLAILPDGSIVKPGSSTLMIPSAPAFAAASRRCPPVVIPVRRAPKHTTTLPLTLPISLAEQYPRNASGALRFAGKIGEGRTVI